MKNLILLTFAIQLWCNLSGQESSIENKNKNKSNTKNPTEIYCENHTIYVDNIINPDLNNFTANVHMKVNAQGLNESFILENVVINQNGNWYYLADNEFAIFPTSMPSMPQECYSIDGIVFEPQYCRIKGGNGLTVNGLLHIPIEIECVIDTTLTINPTTFLGYNSYRLLGSLYLDEDFIIPISEQNVMLKFNQSSNFYFFSEQVFPHLNLELKFQNQHSNINGNSVTFLKNDVSGFSYITFINESNSEDKFFKLFNNQLNISISPSKLILDLSNSQSPANLDASWKGVHIAEDVDFKFYNNISQNISLFQEEPYIQPLMIYNSTPILYTKNGLSSNLNVSTDDIPVIIYGLTSYIKNINLQIEDNVYNPDTKIDYDVKIPFIDEEETFEVSTCLSAEGLQFPEFEEGIPNFEFAPFDKEISLFKIINTSPEVTAIIDDGNKTIEFTYPSNQPMIPYFINSGIAVTVDSINQIRGQSVVDFSTTKTYRIWAADSTYQDWQVYESHSMGIPEKDGINVSIKHSNNIRISKLNSNENYGITLFDINGKVINRGKIENQTEYSIDIQSITNGIYIITIQNENIQKSFKVLKKSKI